MRQELESISATQLFESSDGMNPSMHVLTVDKLLQVELNWISHYWHKFVVEFKKNPLLQAEQELNSSHLNDGKDNRS